MKRKLLFAMMVVFIYIFAEPQLALGRFIPYNIALIIGFSLTALVLGFYIYKLITKKDKTEIVQSN